MRALAILCALLGAGCAAAEVAEHSQPSRPTNFVFLLLDDLGWRDLGCYGSRVHATPNIDRLAAQGMLFTDAYANAPNCAPSRASLMSGQYTPRHGVYTVGTAARGKKENRKLVPVRNTTVLADQVLTLPEVLRDAGYATAAMGKWHLGEDPLTQGFDRNVGGDKRGSPHGGYFSPYKNPSLSDGPKGEYLTDRLTDEALAFLRESRDRPFFLYLSHYAVHTPIQGKPELVKAYAEAHPETPPRKAKYAAMVQSVDESVGRVLDMLEELGIASNTAVFFFSDNGGHGRMTSMDPLRGSKGMLYEGGIRVPLLVRWPGRVEPGSRTATPVIGIDMFPTILEMAGVEAPPEAVLDGESLVGVLGGGGLDREALYWHFPAYLEAYGKGDSPWRTTPASAIRKGDAKLIEFFEDGRLELYLLGFDDGETTDIASVNPEIVAELHADLQAWRRAVAAPVPTELNPNYVPPAPDRP